MSALLGANIRADKGSPTELRRRLFAYKISDRGSRRRRQGRADSDASCWPAADGICQFYPRPVVVFWETKTLSIRAVSPRYVTSETDCICHIKIVILKIRKKITKVKFWILNFVLFRKFFESFRRFNKPSLRNHNPELS